MKSENLVILVGNTGKEVELKHTSSGTAVAKFTLATNERFKDKNEQWQERTEWHNVTCWGRLAEIAAEYVQKGRTLYIKGTLRTDSWDDKQTGQKRYMTYINAKDIILLGSGNGKSDGAAADHSGSANEDSEFASAGADHSEAWPF
jgi:single-strand DNA-binding protein